MVWKKPTQLEVSLFIILFISTMYAQNAHKVIGPYLGQTPPGDTATLFAIDFLGSDLHSGPVFSRDGQEVFWSPLEGNTGHILTSRLTKSGWSSPQEIKFVNGPPNSFEPCLSPDGTRLFFISQETAAKDYRETIWMAPREGKGWGTARLVSPLIYDLETHWQISVAENGNLYFLGRVNGNGDIYLLPFVEGTYQEPAKLGRAINTDHREGSPFVAPDESYLIFSRSFRNSSRKGDLFISFRKSDGTWAEAKNMESLNKDGVDELCATVSRDGKYLFFLRNTSQGFSPHWISSSVIDKYR